ncbi:uncharacterized protein LOC115680559 [Syzygium oleosum]|uniref:uncharacterized protein LOC115680559 n=1 Tax=Syzygium oleosum TaxID=219896 RepID=UPI0011D1B0F3|nr:uncharacterized protein LOC115680559 [Syzygium oleosum]
MEPAFPRDLLLFAVAGFLAVAASTARIHSGNFDPYYVDHCGGVVPPQPPIAPESASAYAKLLQFRGGYFSADGPGAGSGSGHDLRRTVTFTPMMMYKTESEDVINLQGTLFFVDPNVNAIFRNPRSRRLREFHVRGPKIPVRRGMAKFRLHGYWSRSSGKLCMVGSSVIFPNRSFDAVFKLNYPLKLSINSSFVSGVLESLGGGAGGVDHFGTVSVLALSSKSVDYEYSLIENEGGNGSFGEFDDGGGDNLSSEKLGQGLCSALKRNSAFDLEYRSVCDGGNCNPLGTDVGFLPKAMRFTMIQCSEQGKMQLLLKFQNVTNVYYGYYTFDPSTTLIGEGEWDSQANRWCAVACRILNFSTSLTDAFAGYCSIKLCWRFPATFSVINRHPVLGRMWSNETVKDFGYFDKIKFWGHSDALPGVKYEYGVMGSVRKPCEIKTGKHKGKRYPNSYSSDMRFDMSIKNKMGQTALGYSSPLFVGDRRVDLPFHLYDDSYMLKANRTENAVQLDSSHSPLQNISYTMRFTPSVTFELGRENLSSKAVDIFAEGTYNRETGLLCMMGCRYVAQSGAEVYKNGSMDCEIQINIQLHPLTGKATEKIKGTIESTRVKSDPLYFDSLELASSSMYVEQADESILRMDLEIVMALVSNTLVCVFVGLQLFHVKKQPEVLPFISITMLFVLTLGHMIPLLLNFEALVTNHNRQSFFLGSGGWVEVNEVIVRVVTMVAFLLELYLLHMTWSARHGDDSPKGLWVSEKKVIFVSLPMYISGGLIAWFVHQWRNSHRSPFLRQGRLGLMLPPNQLARYQQLSFWGDLKSYAGLILDGFLLPQLLFNLFFDSSVEALSRSYYVGTTIVRLVPHAYDLYRAHSSAWNLDLSYIYANHRMDFYSTAWDIIIPFGGLLFAVFIYLQQRFGGRCILPKRFRGTPVYEKVPTVGTIEL